MEITKYCPKCHTRKSGSEFYKAKHTSDGLAGYCKECTKKIARKYVLDHPEKARKYRETSKGKYSERKKEYGKAYRQRPEVKEREKSRYDTPEYKQAARERYLKNREKRLAYAKQYREENKEKVKETQRKYRAENAEKLKDAKALYARTSPVAKRQRLRYKYRRMQRDPVFALKERARRTIYDAFLRRGYTEKSQAQKILGCDWETFHTHLLETWENRYDSMYDNQDFHIDHIIPLATAKTEEEVLKLCHYTNLQLLKPEDNLAKSSKLPD